MKPYILNYSESTPRQPSINIYITSTQTSVTCRSYLPTDSTIQTRTLESDDNDDIQFSAGYLAGASSTIITKTLEATDEDQIFPESTLSTATTEPSDPDELSFLSTYNTNNKKNYMSTVSTESIEPSDPDEITLN